MLMWVPDLCLGESTIREASLPELLLLGSGVKQATDSGAGVWVGAGPVWHPVVTDKRSRNCSVALVVEPSEIKSIFEHWHWVVELSLLLKLFVGNDAVAVVFELIDPALLLEGGDTVAEGLFLSPNYFLREKTWVSFVNGLTQMELLDPVSWAFDVGWQVEVMLHECLVQERFSYLKAMGSCRSIDSEDVELIELIHKLLRLDSTVIRSWLLLEVEIALSDLVGTLS